MKLNITIKYLYKSKYVDIIYNLSTKNEKFCLDIYISIDGELTGPTYFGLVWMVPEEKPDGRQITSSNWMTLFQIKV